MKSHNGRDGQDPQRDLEVLDTNETLHFIVALFLAQYDSLVHMEGRAEKAKADAENDNEAEYLRLLSIIISCVAELKYPMEYRAREMTPVEEPRSFAERINSKRRKK